MTNIELIRRLLSFEDARECSYLTEGRGKRKKAIAGGTNTRSTAIKPFSSAKIPIKVEDANNKRLILLKNYDGVKDLHGLYTDICLALNIYPFSNEQNGYKTNTPPSKYGVFVLEVDNTSKSFSVRISNHSATCENYVTNDTNMDFNLSIVIDNRNKGKKKPFIPDNRVVAKEFIYLGKRVKGINNPAQQIIASLITFLATGEYIDTTGVAISKTSPNLEG